MELPKFLVTRWSGCGQESAVVFGAPVDAFGDGLHEQLGTWRRAAIAGCELAPDEPLGVPLGLFDADGGEHVPDECLAVGFVIGEGLAGPFAGDEHPPAG